MKKPLNKILIFVLGLAFLFATRVLLKPATAANALEEMRISYGDKDYALLTWNSEDNSLAKMVTSIAGVVSEAVYGTPQKVSVDGQDVLKQLDITDSDSVKNIKQKSYIYTKNKSILFIENLNENGQLNFKSYFKDNRLVRMEVDRNHDGKIDTLQNPNDKVNGYLLVSFYKTDKAGSKGESVGTVAYDDNAVKLETDDPVILELVLNPFVTANREKLEPGSLRHLEAIAKEAKLDGYIIEHSAQKTK